MGLLVAALFGTPAGYLTNHLLGDDLRVTRIVLSIVAGIVAGLAAALTAAFLIFYLTGLDFFFNAILGAVASPPCVALAAWRWRIKEKPANDLRNRKAGAGPTDT